MVTLDATLASLARLEAGQMNILAAQDKLWQSLGAVERKLDRNWEYETNLEKTRLDMINAGLKGTADGVALAVGEFEERERCRWTANQQQYNNGLNAICGAIAELRKELLGTPQRGRKHSYRGTKSLKRSKK